MHYKCHEINFKCGGSYIDSPDWIKSKKAIINPTNKNDNKCFQYAKTAALIHKEIGKKSQRISKVEPFISRYNWVGLNYLSKKDDCKKFKKNSSTIAAFAIC